MVKKPSEIIKAINEQSKDVELLPTGFPRIDAFLDGGLMRKELVVIGAGTGIGKSYVSGQIQLNLARAGFKTACYSLEISNEMVVARMIGGIANVKPAKITTGNISVSEREEIVKAQATIAAHEKYLNFEDNVYEFEELKKAITDAKYDFIIVDFLQNIEVERILDENSQLKKVSRDLQKLAKSQDACILALSQLSNKMASEKAEKVTSAEFRGSGSIAHACDLGFILERGTPTPRSNPLLLHLKKNRRGASGVTFDLEFQYPGGKIYEV